MKTLLDRRSLLLAVPPLAALSACGHLLEPSELPASIYVLSPDLPNADSQVRPSFQIAVAVPASSASLALSRIALRRNETLDYYADVQWTDTTPHLVQDLLITALQRNGAMGAVGRDSEGFHADYVLESDINAFEARYLNGEGAPSAFVDLTVKLVSAGRGDIAGAHDFHSQKLATANSVPAVVQAFDAALSDVLPQIAHWVFASLGTKPR